MVLAAWRSDTPRAQAALAGLCQTYWYPLYAYVRRRGYNSADAEDLTQGFFAQFLEKKYLKDVDPAKGKFRAFLLMSLKHFLANEWDRQHAKKRCAEMPLLAFDATSAEKRYHCEPADHTTPEQFFERKWALTVLARVLARVEDEFSAEGKRELFDKIKNCLSANEAIHGYDRIAQELGMTKAALKMAVHRLRRRYRKLLKDEIAQTVSSPEEVEDEIRCLFAVLS
jgi:RNA polymerase sigma-70 factor (ECF subfamily)